MNIWLDFCEPKSVTMLRPLYERLIKEHEVFITARDFDSTFYLLNQWGVDYLPVGKYGGNSLIGKLKAYSKRLSHLIRIINKKKPDFLFCITSPEALRISFGLQIPNIMFNDEPRSYGPCKTTFPYVNRLIVPKCIPIEWYLKYGLEKELLTRFNGIDEVGWLSDFKPDKNIVQKLGLEGGNYVICRTEPTKAGYLMNRMEPHETKLTEILFPLIEYSPHLKYIILTRNNEQHNHLLKKFDKEISNDTVRILKGLNDLAHIIYFSKYVLSGGGTMVRESALLGIPSIEFFPLETYPQEQFLIDNGFPLYHFHDKKSVVDQALKYANGNFKMNTSEKIKKLENPIEIGIKEFEKFAK
ncbi:MAG: DUF354 domain-containing protein [Candidatus Lokiarchaeota archaeon]|nr:DUF354 domain-containing protein [Candidatus Lokiarchaeota archaeon]MBD3339276.1 DUF354 domain-containing protein [Candidatus Lokiarchaeota archaeon]